MHVRQQVRNFISAKIKEIAQLKNSTFESRIYQFQPQDLPAVSIFTEGEVIESVTKQNKIQRRLIETVVYLFARADDQLENAIDVISELVENKVLQDQNMDGIAVQTVLDNTSLLIGGETDAPTGACRMSFITTIITQQGESGLPTNRSGGIF